MHPNGHAKGIRTILMERGLWQPHLHLSCGKKENIDENPSCCARHLLGTQEDFCQPKKPYLQEVIENLGHKAIFYPKFHPELNFIEMCWGSAKRYARNNCEYTWSSLKTNVPIALDSVSLVEMRRYARRTRRFMECYRRGLDGIQAEFAMKQYKSHRSIVETVYRDVDRQFEN